MYASEESLLLWLLKVQQSGQRSTDCSENERYSCKLQVNCAIYGPHRVLYDHCLGEFIWINVPCSLDCIADLTPYLKICDTTTHGGRKICVYIESMLILHCLIEACSIECVL